MLRLEAAETNVGEVASRAASVISRGGTIVFPTDTVYGIGCDYRSGAAVERIYAIKGRPRHKPLSLHCASVADVLPIVAGAGGAAIAFVERFMPGAVTAIVPRPPSIDASVTAGLASVGVRVPDYALCRAILEATGPLAATSANLSGEPAYTGTGETQLPADLVIEAGPTPHGVESTIVDFSGPVPVLLREGAIARSAIESALGVSFA